MTYAALRKVEKESPDRGRKQVQKACGHREPGVLDRPG